MSNASDFIIENGVLKKYVGSGNDVVIPNGVTTIGEWAFSECSKLTGIVLPEGTVSIGDGAFNRCENLLNVVIPDGVMSVGAKASTPLRVAMPKPTQKKTTSPL